VTNSAKRTVTMVTAIQFCRIDQHRSGPRWDSEWVLTIC